MIILGDIASPNANTSKVVVDALNSAKFKKNQTILFNLEGLITDTFSSEVAEPILYNHSSILNAFKDFDCKVAALANNHTLDLPDLLHSTKHLLKTVGYKSIGAGDRKEADFEYVTVQESGYNVYIYNSCWDFLLYNQETIDNTKTVNVIEELRILNWVKTVKTDDAKAKILIYVHWSFDLETLPFPSYRRFAKSLIDAGVSLVVGVHSHCIQGGETYNGGYIAYGLGNFFIPNKEYANGSLSFPAISDKGWVMEWDIEKNTVQNHWFEYSFAHEIHYLTYLGYEDFTNSTTLNEYSDFTKLSDSEYDLYFKANRRKKLLIPIFYDYKPSIINKLKMSALKTRAKVARFLANRGLISWQN